MKSNFPYKIIDLTHILDETAQTWDRSCGFELKILNDYSDFETEPRFRVHELHIRAGIGTHIDSPSHCTPGAITVEQLDLNDLVAPAVCIDVSKKADENFLFSLDDVHSFEKEHGKIPKNAFIIINTGWDIYWDDKKFHNDYKFPTVSKEACRYFLDQNCVGLGVDTLSPDLPNIGFPVHKMLLGSGRYIVENIAHSKKLPAKDFFTLSLPIKAKSCTEAPIRLIALLPA